MFAFQFPHVNLPPTSQRPLISYIFSARLTAENRPDTADDSMRSFGEVPDTARFLTKPLRVPFMPYVDPSLETPLVSKKPSVRRKTSSEKNGVKRPSNRSAHTLYPPGSPGSPMVGGVPGGSGSANSGNGNPKVRGPKLTLTTADLSSSASSNSAPVIDKPHPSALSSAIERSTRITDSDNNTIAKLTIEMPSSRFLPGDEIVMKLTLQVRDGLPLPKGLTARVVETRALAGESPDGEALEKEQVDDRDEPPLKIKVCGEEHVRVLTGKKLVLHHGEVQPVSAKQPPDSPDTGLAGGRELVEMMTVTLPPFQTFIADSLPPTATLPLGDPRNDADMPESPSPTAPSPKLALDGKGKAVDNSGMLAARTRGLYFRIQHLVQINIPMGGGHHWYQAHHQHYHHNHRSQQDLEVTVPIILGNKNPRATRRPPPAVRLVAPDADQGGGPWRRGGGLNEGSSSSSSNRSNSGPGGNALTATAQEWSEGMKFLTLREAEARPQFVMDL